MTGKQALVIASGMSIPELIAWKCHTDSATIRFVCDMAMQPGPGFREVLEAAGIVPHRKPLLGLWGKRQAGRA